ncbi:hypothetical protein Hanom_Chr13g01199681 [Helianthus anomalus]
MGKNSLKQNISLNTHCLYLLSLSRAQIIPPHTATSTATTTSVHHNNRSTLYTLNPTPLLPLIGPSPFTTVTPITTSLLPSLDHRKPTPTLSHPSQPHHHHCYWPS